MKIAVLGVKQIPAKQGDTERHCQELYTKIAARGHQVDLFAQPKYSQETKSLVSHYKSIRIIALPLLPERKLFFFLSAAINTVRATFGNYDIIHFYGVKSAFVVWFAKLFSVSKIVVSCQQLDHQKYKRKKPINQLLLWLEKVVVKNADELIVDSKTLAKYFEQNYDLFASHIPNAPVSYRPNKNKISYVPTFGLDKKQYILYLGKLEPSQRLDLLIRAFIEVESFGWQLVIAGDIDDDAEYAVALLKLAKQHDKIIFINEVRGSCLAEILQCAGLLVYLSSETNSKLSSVILEAMESGTPVLASDIPVHRELIGSDRGLLFAPDRLESLSSKLKCALANPILLRAVSRRSQTYIAIHHNWDRVVYKNLFLYLKNGVRTQVKKPRYRIFDN